MNDHPHVSAALSQLQSRVADQSAKVGIIGLGYVGLPLVAAFVDCGYRTIGFDVDQRKVDQLLAGESYISHIDSAWIAKCITEETFEPTADMARLGEADVLLICVPTPLTDSRDPDLSYVTSTAQKIAATLRPGQLVVLESTTYPGTTRDVLLPVLAQSGLKVGDDFLLAYSPEREDPGNPNYTASGIPKVVGGVDPLSCQIACDLYSAAVVSIVPVDNCEIAEACKILENTYRAVNIALVNELKVLLEKIDIDVWQVIEAAKTKPFGFQAFYPGPGLGGHCIPIDPFYLSWLARKHELSTRFIELAGEVNAKMPQYVIDQLIRALNSIGKPVKGSKICLLGMAYKRDVDDPRESPSFKLLELLVELGADVSYNDPHISKLPAMRHYDVPDLVSQDLTPAFLESLDCVLISTDHSAYDWAEIVRDATLIVDTRNATFGVPGTEGKVWKA